MMGSDRSYSLPRISAVWALLVGWSTLQAQVDSVAVRYAGTITQTDLKRHLEILASDAFEGRDTGARGQKMAAAYLVEQFKGYGIGPVPVDATVLLDGYQQQFPLLVSKLGGLSIQVPGRQDQFLEEYLYFSERVTGTRRIDSVLVLLPTQLGAVGRVGNDKALMVFDTGRPKELRNWFFQRVLELGRAAERSGAGTVVFVVDDVRPIVEEFEHHLTTSRMQLADQVKEVAPGAQVVVMDLAMARAALEGAGVGVPKLLKKLKRKAMSMPVAMSLVKNDQQEKITGENVLAYIEGTGAKEEVVVITAHYDHIGMENGEVFNGADDDGSGTVALLEIAEAFMKAKEAGYGPYRSVLVMPVSGEEKGLLGSEYYSRYPVFPLANTVADLNIDMIGRVDSLHEADPEYVYIIGSDRLSTQLHAANERANSAVGLELDYRYNAPDDPNRFYYRSDHYNFAKHGIPSIFYFNGVHEDYHGPKDEVDRIHFDLLEKRTKLVFLTAWDLANRPDRIRVDVPAEDR